MLISIYSGYYLFSFVQQFIFIVCTPVFWGYSKCEKSWFSFDDFFKMFCNSIRAGITYYTEISFWEFRILSCYRWKLSRPFESSWPEERALNFISQFLFFQLKKCNNKNSMITTLNLNEHQRKSSNVGLSFLNWKFE